MDAAAKGLLSATNELCIASAKTKSASGITCARKLYESAVFFMIYAFMQSKKLIP